MVRKATPYRLCCLCFGVALLCGSSLHGCGGSSRPPVPGHSPSPTPQIGRGFGDGKLAKNEDLQLLSAMSWWYSWSLNPSPSIKSNFSQEFVAMVWGEPSLAQLSGWTPYPNTKHLLGFNEPNMRSQSNMTGEIACKHWSTVVAAAKQHNLMLGSPAANYCKKGGAQCYQTPDDWFDDFFAQPGCGLDSVDFIATHKYGCNATETISYVKHLYNRYKKPVWLTEFSCNDAPPAKHLAFMKEILPVFDQMPEIIPRYAWFAARIGMPFARRQKGGLIDGDNLSMVGEFYNSTISVLSPQIV